ncbi:Apoptosis inhibitor 5-like [Holothuria leucospilota]|uniref:Apoptosis inhibitor 5-like n=1 Tax=Holothuria leucospilota TaxID=206669 RepID=A0A9Q0YKS2_HOLLE|nr:Apoptosis inhibitor 5-like [Holothuria leucospilota]
MASVEQLYKDYGILADAKEKAGEHEDTYNSILAAVEGGTSEKRLAAQFIPKFFKYFPSLSEKAIHAQLDLCEDEDSSIRRQAIKELPNLCRASPDNHFHIADVLTQLLQSDDPQDTSIVNSALMALFKLDAENTLGGLFNQILTGEELVRERAIKFLSMRIKTFPEDIITPQVEETLIQKCKEVLSDVTGEEFISFMKILSSTKTMQSLQGRKQLVDLIVDQGDFQSDFIPTEPDLVDRLTQCLKQAVPLFSKNVQSTQFVEYLCEKVIPVLDDIKPAETDKKTENGDKEDEVSKAESKEEDDKTKEGDSEEKQKDEEGKEAGGKTTQHTGDQGDDKDAKAGVKLEILKYLADMAIYSGEIAVEPQMTNLYNSLLEYMPLPPPESEEDQSEESKDDPQLQFSVVECLMHTFHCLAHKQPDFLAGEANAERLKDFRIRLQYFARGVQLSMKQLRLALRGKTGNQLKTDENKIKVAALRITSNINTLIKDLMHNPPSYKSSIILSWKPIQKQGASTSPEPAKKRPNITPITFDSDKKTQATSKKARGTPYSPPGGKYSSKAGRAPTGGDANYGNWGSSNYGGSYGNYNRNKGRGRNRGRWY